MKKKKGQEVHCGKTRSKERDEGIVSASRELEENIAES